MSSNNATTPSVPNSEGWALRILRSSSIHGYGVGLYSFFNNYNTSCSDITSEGICQTRIFSVEGDGLSHDINIYNLNTVGSVNMVTRDGMDLVKNVDNNSTFVDGLNVLRF
jgi:glucan 1,3-beta-glucosidase